MYEKKECSEDRVKEEIVEYLKDYDFISINSLAQNIYSKFVLSEKEFCKIINELSFNRKIILITNPRIKNDDISYLHVDSIRLFKKKKSSKKFRKGVRK